MKFKKKKFGEGVGRGGEFEIRRFALRKKEGLRSGGEWKNGGEEKGAMREKGWRMRTTEEEFKKRKK